MVTTAGPFLFAILGIFANNVWITSTQSCPPTWEDGASIPGLTNAFYPVDLDNDMKITSTEELVSLPLETITIFDVAYNMIEIGSDGYISLGQSIGPSVPTLFPFYCGFSTSETEVQSVPSNGTLQAPLPGGGEVYYKQTADADLRCRFAAHVVAQGQAPADFEPTSLLIITWYGVICGFVPASPPDVLNGPALGPGLYYQTVIGSHGGRTFVCYIYGTIPDDFIFQQIFPSVGYNNRDSVNVRFISVDEGIDMIESVNGNTGQIGKYMFRINGDPFTPEPCIPGPILLPIRFSSQCGGKRIFIFGPCYDPDPSGPGIKCDFDGTIVDGTVLDANRAYCITPFLVSYGYIVLRVSIDGGITYSLSTGFHIVGGDFDYEITRVAPLTWLFPDFTPLTFTWDADILNSLGTVSTVNVDVAEFTIDGTLGDIIRIITDTNNDGSDTIDGNLPETIFQEKLLIFCALRITPSDLSLPQVVLWSDFHPCLWYSTKLLHKISRDASNIVGATTIKSIITSHVGPLPDMTTISNNLRDLLSPTIGSAACNAWINFEISNPVTFSLADPPCTEEIAKRDQRFRLTCLADDCEFYHNGAASCFAPWFGFPHGQEVCYDASGNIILSGAMGGGTLDRSFSIWGNTLDHIRDDLWPFVACCKAGTNANCDQYYIFRPTDNCADYMRPRFWWGFGDPHYWTYDGRLYTFNPVGEFWMVYDSLFKVQARMERFDLASNDGTIVTSMVAKKGSSPTIEVRLNDTFNLIVIIDGQEEDLKGFENNIFSTPDNLVHILKMSNDDIEMRFQRQSGSSCDGEVITIRQVFGTMQLNTFLPECYKGDVSGLQGDFDDDPANDFRPRSGGALPDTASPQSIHDDFGESWRISAGESLFTYRDGESYNSFNDKSYRPLFFTESQLLSTPNGGFCNGNLQCLYDFRVTHNRDFAEATLEVVEEARQSLDLFKSASNPCLSNPCVTGLCRPSSTVNMTIFECFCPIGFSGISCEDDVCDPNPCQNDGTCTPQLSDDLYNCACPPHYLGLNCEIRDNSTVCDSNPCRYGGICQVIGYGYICSCYPGYTGRYCEREIDPCESDPCLNGADCFVTSGTEYACRCKPGYSGVKCETAVCDPNPCVNGATCILDEKDVARCVCPPGYAGIHCHISSDGLRTGLTISLVLFLVLSLFLITILCLILYCDRGTCRCFQTSQVQVQAQPVGIIRPRFRYRLRRTPRLPPKYPIYNRQIF